MKASEERRIQMYKLALVLVLIVAMGGVAVAQAPPITVFALGVAQVQGRDVIVDILVVVPPGQDVRPAEQEVGR